MRYDRQRRRVLWAMPYGLYVVGSTDGGERRNGMTLNWASQVSFEPKLLGISVEKHAFTHELIDAGGVFSLCIVDREDRAIVRKFSKPVDVDLAAKTLNGFPYFDGITGAPILSQSAAYVDCRVHQAVDVGGHTLFLGEVAEAAFLKPEDTPVLRMEDTRMSYGGDCPRRPAIRWRSPATPLPQVKAVDHIGAESVPIRRHCVRPPSPGLGGAIDLRLRRLHRSRRYLRVCDPLRRRGAGRRAQLPDGAGQGLRRDRRAPDGRHRVGHAA